MSSNYYFAQMCTGSTKQNKHRHTDTVRFDSCVLHWWMEQETNAFAKWINWMLSFYCQFLWCRLIECMTFLSFASIITRTHIHTLEVRMSERSCRHKKKWKMFFVRLCVSFRFHLSKELPTQNTMKSGRFRRFCSLQINCSINCVSWERAGVERCNKNETRQQKSRQWMSEWCVWIGQDMISGLGI